MNPPPRTVCAVTGSRADYGLLLPVLRAVRAHPDLRLQLVVTGSHLEPRLGHTVDAIVRDGLDIDRRIPLDLETDDPAGVTRALARAVSGFGEALADLRPDLVLVLGDRYEILGCVQAALIAGVPVAHIAGGDLTEGAFDDAIRHAITKMSHLHFATHAEAARRLRQLGESADRVFITGSPGIDQLRQTPRLTRARLEQRLGMALRTHNLAITFHPETLDPGAGPAALEALLAALDRMGEDTGLIFTGSNADPLGQALDERVRQFTAAREHAVFHASLGQQAYYSLLEQVDAVVGNSSSGLYEAPSFGIPTVNIGDRQKGRPRAASVIDCAANEDDILDALHQALASDFSQVENPYGDGHAAERIVEVLAGPWRREKLIRKRFAGMDGHA